jgi:uncharacterized membrane protein (UPF0127 family)
VRHAVNRLPIVLPIVLVLAAGAAACGDDEPAASTIATTSPSTTSPSTTNATTSAPTSSPPAGVRPDGFELVAARSTAADGTTCELCLWLADAREDRARGLMGVTDLAPADGMVFRYAEPTTTAFTMRNTLIPLSIVFYGPDTNYLDAFEMVPCEAEPCPTYPTPEGFTLAVEVPSGDLDALGLTPGSTLVLLDGGCPAP